MKLMSRITASLSIIIVIFLMVKSNPIHLYSQEKLLTIEVNFSPNGGCTEAIIRELNKAKSTILLQAYSFTSVPIAKALLNAHKRGVKVEVILDKSQRTQKYSSATFLCNQGISVKIDAQHAIAHNKVMIVDGEVVITGSFNFTKAAEKNNAENLLVIRDKKLAEQYIKNWQEHERHLEVYTARGGRIFPEMTVLENVEMGAYTRKSGYRENLDRVYRIFPVLKERSGQLGETLSGGEQQMLTIGRALMARPKLLLLGEPSMGLAPTLVRTIFNIIRDINEEGTTVLWVEQNALMALSIAKTGYVIQTGRVVLKDSAQNLILKPQVREAYLGKRGVSLKQLKGGRI
jgi:ABC-type branched-subunit amino acid transport system ATPase component